MGAEFSPGVGAEIEWRGLRGVIKFVCEEYLTMCIKKAEDRMVADVCLVIPSYQWDEILLTKGSGR